MKKSELNQTLCEATENNKVHTIIRRLYKIISQHNKIYSDSGWESVTELLNDMKNVDGVESVYTNAGVYHNYLNNNTDMPYRTYELTIETIYNKDIGGEIVCSAAGTMEDPFKRYDISCTLWKK